MGNDIDDALALAVLHELADRGEAEILAVTLSKDNDLAAPFVDALNTFYGRPDIPIGVVRGGKTPEDGSYLRAVTDAVYSDGSLVFPRDLKSGADAPEAVDLIRKILAANADGSVCFVTVGFLTNAARLLESKPDDASPLDGMALAKQKISQFVMMAGAFSPERAPEYNVHIDAESSRTVFERWPTPIVASGFEIGLAIEYPASSIERDYQYVERHPIPEAYRVYMKFPYDRPTWDLTAALYAVRPDHDYFALSMPGRITLGEKSVTYFSEDPNGTMRFLIASPEQMIRVKEALIELASSPAGK